MDNQEPQKPLVNHSIPPPEPRARLLELGPHPERRAAALAAAASAQSGADAPILDVEVKIKKIKPHHYALWALSAMIIGFSLTHSAIQAGNLAISHLKSSPPETINLAENYNGESQGSDDSVSVTDSVSGSYSVLNAKKVLSLSATNYLIGDIDTGDIILEKNGTTKSPMASVTKLMTAVVDLETLNQLAYATVTPASTESYPLTGDLIMNEAIKISDLKYPLLVVSSNVAAEVFANFVGRDKFLSELNDKASALEMNDSKYDDPSGLSPKSVSTPEDLFKLAQYIKTNHPEIFDIGRIREYSILGHTWINQNHQLTYSTFGGGKNGFTDEAEKTTVSLFNLPFNPTNKSDKRTVAVILLHTNDREGDISRILSYLSSNVRYEQKPLDVGGSVPGPAINNAKPDN